MRYAFVNGIILDGTEDMQPVRGKAVLTDGDRIVDITGDVAALDGYEVIDLKGGVPAPGADRPSRPPRAEREAA